MKYIITLISIFTFFNSFSQTQEQIYQFKYEMSKEFKKQPNYKIINKKYNPEDIYIKTKSKKEILQNSANIFAEKANITVEKKDDNQIDIILNSQFPPYLNEELFSLVKLNSVKSNLFNSKMDKVELSKSSFNNFGGKFKNDSNTELEYQTIQNQTITRKNKETNLTGSLFYELSFLTDYSILKLDKSKIGSIIELNNLKYELVEIRMNKVVLKKLYDSNYENNIKLLIFNKNNELIVFDKNSKNSLISTEECEKSYFEFISQNENYTLEEFKKQNKFENIISKKGLYLVLEGVSNIENAFILYEPIYGVKKEFEVKMK